MVHVVEAFARARGIKLLDTIGSNNTFMLSYFCEPDTCLLHV